MALALLVDVLMGRARQEDGALIPMPAEQKLDHGLAYQVAVDTSSKNNCPLATFLARAYLEKLAELQAAQDRAEKLLRFADHNERCKRYRHDFHLWRPMTNPIPCLCGFISVAQRTEEPSA